jgi:rsbT co-antagonist protein RsbR
MAEQKADLLQAWTDRLMLDGQGARIDAATIQDFCSRLLDEIAAAFAHEPTADGWVLPPALRDLLSAISADFAERGFTPSQTATLIFGLKRQLSAGFAGEPEARTAMDELIDAMGLFSMDAFIVRREHIIRRQTEELLEISVPVVPLWEGVLSLPIIGTLDSGRAQAITEKLLFEIARTSSRYAVLDISGVPTVDTQTAQYLAKTVAAARLMGAECVITGIKPAIAQVMVALGINLVSIETRFSMADGLRYCFAKQGLTVRKQEA